MQHFRKAGTRLQLGFGQVSKPRPPLVVPSAAGLLVRRSTVSMMAFASGSGCSDQSAQSSDGSTPRAIFADPQRRSASRACRRFAWTVWPPTRIPLNLQFGKKFPINRRLTSRPPLRKEGDGLPVSCSARKTKRDPNFHPGSKVALNRKWVRPTGRQRRTRPRLGDLDRQRGRCRRFEPVPTIKFR